MSSARRKKLRKAKLGEKHLSDNKSPNNHRNLSPKYSVEGQVGINGSVEIRETQSVTHQHESEEKKANAYKEHTKEHETSSLTIARVTAAVTAIYLVFTILIFSESKRSADAAKSAADTASRQLELAERPWIRVDLQIAGPLIIDANGMSLVVRAITRSTGNSPAAAVLMESKMFVNYAWPVTLINAKRDAFCEGLKRRDAINQKYLKSIFPGGQEPPENQHLSVPKTELDQALKGGNGRVLPVVITCAVYQSTFNNRVYETAYISGIMSIEQGIGMAVPGDKVAVITPDRLFMETQTFTTE